MDPTTQSLSVAPGPTDDQVRTANGELLRPPADWQLVPPGDAALTRRLKAAGPTWAVQEKRGRKVFSRGLWAPTSSVERIRAELAAERADPAYARKRAADAQRRDRRQGEYVEDFQQAVLQFLHFHSSHEPLAKQLAQAVTIHATPVGSGTVARTQRIPIERRAEAAVIAWMRHQTTAYDGMTIPRVKGKRREVRRMLAERSKRLLEAYRTGRPSEENGACPLRLALSKHEPEQ